MAKAKKQNAKPAEAVVETVEQGTPVIEQGTPVVEATVEAAPVVEAEAPVVEAKKEAKAPAKKKEVVRPVITLTPDAIAEHNAITIKGITNSAVLALGPIVAEMRSNKIKGKDIAEVFEMAGANSASSVSIVSDLRAVGDYMKYYPDVAEKLSSAPTGKEWRDYLCAARRGHRLSNGGVEGEAKAKLLAKAGAKSHKCSTASAFLKEHDGELQQTVMELRGFVAQDGTINEAPTNADTLVEHRKTTARERRVKA